MNISPSYIIRNGIMLTFPQPGCEKVLLQDITINKKCKKSTLNYEAYNTFSMGKYYNRIISAKFRLNLRINKNQNKKQEPGKTSDQ